jgi:hypothetical protein
MYIKKEEKDEDVYQYEEAKVDICMANDTNGNVGLYDHID